MSEEEQVPGSRLTSQSIRSFVLRQGRMSDAQHRFLDEMMPKVGVPYRPEAVDLNTVFGRHAPHIVEIGFGIGQSTAVIAQARPDEDFLGIEVHAPGVGGLCKLIEEGGITNLRIVQHDAVEVLRDMIPEGSLAGVHIYFPRPLAQEAPPQAPPGAGAIRQADRLASGAGWLPALRHRLGGGTAHQMLEVLSAEPMLANTAEGFAPKPDYRPLTKFENRGIKLGHGVWDVIFRRV